MLAPFVPSAPAQDDAAIRLLIRARAAQQQGNADEALSLATRAIEAAPRYLRAYLFRGALNESQRRYARAIDDYDQAVRLQPEEANYYNLRGQVHFKQGSIEASITDFDKAVELDPGQEPHHWQRGIAYYYAELFEKGARQFEQHQTVSANDVENAVWRYLCRARREGVEKARVSLLPIGHDRRIPMMRIYALYEGGGTVEEVFAAARAGNPSPIQRRAQLFYAHLYVGLYHEAHGNTKEAREHILQAVQEAEIADYMGDVARVHAQQRGWLAGPP